MDSQAPRVAIILLNWNGYQDTVECLESLRGLDYPNAHIVLVDNASTDGSEDRLRAMCRPEDVTILQSGANLGFAGGNNVGIRYALAQGADYLWLLNTDTLVDPGALTALVRRAEANPSLGLIGSRIFFTAEPRHLWYAGGTLYPRTGMAIHEPYDVPDAPEFDQPHPTDFVTGCSILARRAVVEQIGGLPEEYFYSYEDVDWCYQARQAGWGIFYEPRSVVHHKVSVSVGRSTPRQLFLATRARILFVKRRLPKSYGSAVRFTLGKQVAFNLLRRHPRVALAHLQGLRAGMRYRAGDKVLKP